MKSPSYFYPNWFKFLAIPTPWCIKLQNQNNKRVSCYMNSIQPKKKRCKSTKILLLGHAKEKIKYIYVASISLRKIIFLIHVQGLWSWRTDQTSMRMIFFILAKQKTSFREEGKITFKNCCTPFLISIQTVAGFIKLFTVAGLAQLVERFNKY